MHLQTWLRLLAAAGAGEAHMQMTNPPPLKSKANPNTSPENAAYSYTNPLSTSGSDYPCKGYLSLLGTPEGVPVATWNAGESYSATISGHATHAGGSCQITVSVDGGNTFKVIHSYIGGCPSGDGATLGFTLPGDTPSSDQAILAWSWFNNLGNREMYMNCAVIKIAGGGNGGRFDDRPNIFRANTNGCRTVDSKDVMIPNPGPDVDLDNPSAVPPTGDCDSGPGASKSSGSGPGLGSGAGHHGDGGRYTPGNDWPPDFNPNNGWSLAVGPEQVLVLVGVVMLSMLLALHLV